MPNPTAQVPSTITDFDDCSRYWPLTQANAAYTYQIGQMMGLDAAGDATNMDDTAARKFLGLSEERVLYDGTAGKLKIRVKMPRLICMPLSSGTVAATDRGKPVYAIDAGHVSLTPGTVANLVGYVEEIHGASPLATTATEVIFSPRPVLGASVSSSTAVNGITASATSDQAGATPLTAAINRVTTVVTIGDSVLLPAATAGSSITVINAAALAMDVFPAVGDNINALADNVALSQLGGVTRDFYCALAGTWNTAE